MCHHGLSFRFVCFNEEGWEPPPRDVDVLIYILPWGLDLGGPLVLISEVHLIVVA